MFYSAHDNVLSCQLVGIGPAEDQTTEEQASNKVMLETVLAVQGFHSSALAIVCFFFTYLPSSSSDLLPKVGTELLTIPCSSSAMNNTATKSKCVICFP